MSGTQTLEPHDATCSWCDQTFDITDSQRGALKKGQNIYCSRACRVAFGNAQNSRYTLGPCPTCGKMFGSKTKNKTYCTLGCYTASPKLAEHLKRLNDEKKNPPGTCPHCGKEFQSKSNKKYCTDACRRKYFAARFDRWIANPEKLALPQNFDEYMAQDYLHCLVEGCDWMGENLGSHVNFAHGITAKKFKEMVGFNNKTGLVGSALRTHFSEKAKKFIEDGVWKLTPENLDKVDRTVKRGTPRLEAKEHGVKGRALVKDMDSHRDPLPCRWCQEPVEQSYFGVKLYCNLFCRTKYYQEKGRAELCCDYCGKMFEGERAQVLRAQRGLKICCSQLCRNRMNMVACLGARGIEMGPR